MPFFHILGDKDYKLTLDSYSKNYEIIYTSKFCTHDDKFPDLDLLIDTLTASKKCVVAGLGEYLALRGEDFALKTLGRIKNLTGDIVFLLRGISEQAKKFIRTDQRIRVQKNFSVANNLLINLAIRHLDLPGKILMRELLERLENGFTGTIETSTSLNLDLSLFPVEKISGAYGLIKAITKIEVPQEIFTSQQWQYILQNLQKYNNLHNLFAHMDLDINSPLAFLYMKLYPDKIKNLYLRLVVSETKNFADLRKNLLLRIIDISHNDLNFHSLYNERKKIDFTDSEIEIFIKANEADPSESIYKLTDNSIIERKAIIKYFTHYDINDAIKYIYPDLYYYMKEYNFSVPELTEYMNFYKQAKLTNKISDRLLTLINIYAKNLFYTRFPSRDSTVKALAGGNNFLYWVDALGIEYLPLIKSLAERKNLSLEITIARANLPTITSTNKNFYEQWPGAKYKDSRLDDIKHHDKGGYFFTHDKDPIHIPEELSIISEIINLASGELNAAKCRKFIIASDHGASRLPVIANQELPYNTDTGGEYSGRFCKYFEGCNVPHSLRENDYIILSDCGRFRGGRRANVEVHGGALLEEILTPVIVLTLKAHEIAVKLLNPDEIFADIHNGVNLTLYISHSNGKIIIFHDNKKFDAHKLDDTHYLINLDIKRARKEPYSLEIFDDNISLGRIKFNVKSKTASINPDFDF